MAIAFLIIGAALIIAAIRNTYGTLGTLLAGDFTGSGSFLYWIVLLLIVAGIGLIPSMQTPSRLLLALIVVGYLLKDGTGFWSQLQSALRSGPQAEPASATTLQTPTGGLPITVSTSSSGNNLLTSATQGLGFLDALGNLIP